MNTAKIFSGGTLKAILSKTPIVKTYFNRYTSLLTKYNDQKNAFGYPPGHYYSPVPLITDVEKNYDRIFRRETIRDIELRPDEQYDLLEQLKRFHSIIPYDFNQLVDTPAMYKNSHLRYRSNELWYRYSDAIFLFALLNYFRPKKIIEVGSGHSSAIMLDTNECFLDNSLHMTFIEPYPEERLLKILKEGDEENTHIIKSNVQDVDVTTFMSLEKNDILFIDSTHVSKIGSDVNFIFFEILPILKPGVLIHFHDIFYPFEMPAKWVCQEKRFWNENYLLRAFLMNNDSYEIVLFNSFMQKKYRNWFLQEMPNCLIEDDDTGSIWIRKK